MSIDDLTLSMVAESPESVTRRLPMPDGAQILFRPLLPTDTDGLTAFLESLSTQTRAFWELGSFDRSMAATWCDDIARYDKLRLVALDEVADAPSIIAIFEFSLDLVPSDIARYRSYGIELVAEETCRFAPCVRDDYQNGGLASSLMPHTVEIARRFGRNTLILLGGVHAGNARAIRFYEKSGFRTAGPFVDNRGRDCFDMILAV